jgi:hypothetical protein
MYGYSTKGTLGLQKQFLKQARFVRFRSEPFFVSSLCRPKTSSKVREKTAANLNIAKFQCARLSAVSNERNCTDRSTVISQGRENAFISPPDVVRRTQQQHNAMVRHQNERHRTVPRGRHLLITDYRKFKPTGFGLSPRQWHEVNNNFRTNRSPGSKVEIEVDTNMYRQHDDCIITFLLSQVERLVTALADKHNVHTCMCLHAPSNVGQLRRVYVYPELTVTVRDSVIL